jgi:chromosomal replication initiator protein
MLSFIVDIVAKQYGLTRAQLTGRRRWRHVVRARHIACYLRLEQGASLKQAGRAFHRHHTSILHARDVMGRKIAIDPEFAKEIEKLRRRIISAAA